MHKINSILVSTTSTESKACKHMNHSSSSIAHFCHAHIIIFSLMVLDGFLNASAPEIPQCLKTFAPIQQVSQFSQFTRGFYLFIYLFLDIISRYSFGPFVMISLGPLPYKEATNLYSVVCCQMCCRIMLIISRNSCNCSTEEVCSSFCRQILQARQMTKFWKPINRYLTIYGTNKSIELQCQEIIIILAFQKTRADSTANNISVFLILLPPAFCFFSIVCK